VQVQYSLTRSGRELMAALDPLVAWGDHWNPTGREKQLGDGTAEDAPMRRTTPGRS